MQEALNRTCDTSVYSLSTQHAMAQLSEKEIPFELIEALLNYFRSLNTPGAVLIFLPGWNSIFALLRHLSGHNVFGKGRQTQMLMHVLLLPVQCVCVCVCACSSFYFDDLYQVPVSIVSFPATLKSHERTRGRSLNQCHKGSLRSANIYYRVAIVRGYYNKKFFFSGYSVHQYC